MYKNCFSYRCIIGILLVLAFGLYSPATAQESTLPGMMELGCMGRGLIHDIAISPAGDTLAVASSIGVWLYEFPDMETIGLLDGFTGWVATIAYSPDGQILASAGEDGTIRLWNVANQRQIGTLTGHPAKKPR